MNIPFDNPVIQFLYWLLNTPGLGGIAVLLVGSGSILAYGLTLRWIKTGGELAEVETFAYPTPALTHSQEIET
ncbi:MAG: hypothetical protein WAM60_06290 [Candidatus Promineifilaceae bacterium]